MTLEEILGAILTVPLTDLTRKTATLILSLTGNKDKDQKLTRK